MASLNNPSKKDMSVLADAVSKFQSTPVMQEVKTGAGIVGKGTGTFGTSNTGNNASKTNAQSNNKFNIPKITVNDSAGILGKATNQLKTDITAYQQNMQKLSTDPRTLRSSLSQVYEMAKFYPEKATEALGMLNQLMQDPTSMYYNPYVKPTNQAVSNLEAMGIDCSNIDDNWLKEYSWLKNYYTYSGTTNTPSDPGKKASKGIYSIFISIGYLL